jgi:peptidoglycan/xylan/chitin deacetylase (PgdA/CDA1 family)
MSAKQKIAWSCFTAIALVPGLVLLGFHNRSESHTDNSVVQRRTFPPANPASMVTLTFDDGFASAYQYGLPIVDAAGMKSTQYIITGSLGLPGYITREDVLAMNASGHEIGAHTKSHPSLPQLTPGRLKDEVAGSLHDLEALGIHPTTFAYPYGDYNDNVVAAVKSAGFTSARTCVGGYDSATSTTLLLKSKIVMAETTSKDINAWIDESQAKGTWLILVFQRIDEYSNPISVNHEVLQDIVDRLLAQKIRVVTVSQGLSILKLKP